MKPQYVAIAEKSPKSIFRVWFPDVEGCEATGVSLAEASANAATALREHMDGLRGAGQALPPARTIDDVMRDDVVKKAIAAGGTLLSVPLDRT